MADVSMGSLRWIIIDDTRHILPLGSKSGHLYLSEELPGGTWQVEHIATAAYIRSGLTSGRSFERARQFAEAYALACKPQKGLTDLDAPWRLNLMSEAQHANLAALGVTPAPGMKAGDASDLFQRVKAARALAMSIAL